MRAAEERCPVCDGWCGPTQTARSRSRFPAPVCPGHKELVREVERLDKSKIRPLHRLGYGAWRSHDGRWTFLRHQSDPHPQRWYVYEEFNDGEFPVNEGSGITTLRDAVAFAERLDVYVASI